MKNKLISDINSANTSEELFDVIYDIPKQTNGEKTTLCRILDDTFWYYDLKTVEQQKAHMLRIIEQCPELFYNFS